MKSDELVPILRNVISLVADSGMVDLEELLKGEGFDLDEIKTILYQEPQDIKFKDFENIENNIGTYESENYEICPICGTEEVQWDNEKILPETFFIYRVHKCRSCNSKWEERYSLDQVRLMDDEEDVK